LASRPSGSSTGTPTTSDDVLSSETRFLRAHQRIILRVQHCNAGPEGTRTFLCSATLLE
jgi:hypothetical protein